jgi:hypothetical protein
MKPERLAAYEGLIRNVEEPIREIVRAVWHLPFVRDTGYMCCGHVLKEVGFEFGTSGQELRPVYEPYVHRVQFEIAFEPDEELQGEVEAFKAGLIAVLANHDGREMRFNRVWGRGRANRLYSSGEEPLHQHWQGNADIPDLNEYGPNGLSNEELESYEPLLIEFWEQVAAVVRQFAPDAEIGPIAGRSFRQMINWVDWGCRYKTP